MLQEALEYIVDRADQVAVAKVNRKPFEIPGIDDRAFLADPKTAVVTEYQLPPPRRGHKVGTVLDLCNAVKALTEDMPNAEHGAPVSVRIWIGDGLITAVLDDDVRRDFVTMQLVKTETFNRVVNLSGKALSQKDLIQHLRTTLRTADFAPGLLHTVRSIKFKSSESGHAEVVTGRESMGRSVEAAVTGATEFPEDLSLSVQVFRDHSFDSSFEETLALTFDCIVEEQKFKMELLPDLAQTVTDNTLSKIADFVSKQFEGNEQVDVLCGSFK